MSQVNKQFGRIACSQDSASITFPDDGRSLFQIATKVQIRNGRSGSELAGGEQAWRIAGASRQQLELELELER